MDSALPLLIAAAVYVYFSVSLMTIARKTGTPDEWMAWVPIANMALMCRVGRKPMFWVLLMFIPIVNLFISVALCGAVARARGKSPAIGWLLLVPLVNFLVPAILAAGPSPYQPAAAGYQPAAAVYPPPRAATQAPATTAVDGQLIGTFCGAVITGIALACIVHFAFPYFENVLPKAMSRPVVSRGSAFAVALITALALVSRTPSTPGAPARPWTPPAQPHASPTPPAQPYAPQPPPARAQTRAPQVAPCSIVIGGRRIALGLGVKLITADLPGLQPEGGGSVVADVGANPQNPSVLGLKNRSRRAWTATMPDGSQRKIDTGKTVKLAAGVRIDFGAVQGEIV
jgi:hypothetical protein